MKPPAPHAPTGDSPFPAREGKCRKCGKPFRGAPNRRYCDEHSFNVKYRGKG
jgi:hypothetical protein